MNRPGVDFGLFGSPFDADQDVLGVEEAEFLDENRGITDDGGVDAGSDSGTDVEDAGEPPRSLRTPFMASSREAVAGVDV